MSIFDIKKQVAVSIATAFQKSYPEKYEQSGDESVFSWEFILEHLEQPKNPEMGQFALPVFRYARDLGGPPPAIATATSASMMEGRTTPIEKVQGVSGFINIKTDPVHLAKETLTEILTEGRNYGASDVGQNRKYLVEYSSVNIAKPFGIGHLRTTILGNSLRRITKKLGYDTVGINYLGDWGTQFGKLIVAYRKWGEGLDLNEDCVEQLYRLYVRYHEEAKTDPTLDDEARVTFKKLEDGDPEITALWTEFKDLSLKEFDRVYKRLGIEFDLITGESFFNDKMEAVIERLEKAGLTSISQGALIVDLNDPQLPPLLLKKSDGATLYATRDLAGLIWRWETYRFEESLYVVAVSQSDHFKQAFKVIELLEDAEQTPAEDRMTGKVKHVDFGWVKFGDKGMSTRAGSIIFLDDVVNKAVDLARELIVEKNPALATIDETANMIGTGAVIFSQMSVRRQKDVNFQWDAVLNFEGETGPYLQYTNARLCSLLRKYGNDVNADIDFKLLVADEEQRVIEMLADFPTVVADASRQYDPFVISSYLLKLTAGFNKFYQRKDAKGKSDKIISDNAKLTSARMALVRSVQFVVAEGLYLLGIQTPEEM